jgi:PAS domain S-box-containing protein
VDAQAASARALLDERWIPFVGHLVLLALVAILVWDVAPHDLLGLWATAVLVLTVARAVWFGYARRRNLSFRNAARTTRIFMAGLGLAWSLGAAIVAPYLPLATLSIVIMAFAGLLAGAINTLVADRWAFPIYAVALFGPTLTARVLLRSGDAGLVEEVLIGLFVAFMVVQHGRAHRSLMERLRIEAELRNRERQLASAQTIAHVGSWDWDVPTNRVTWSDELCRILGVPEDTPASYAAFVERVHPEDRPRVERLVAEGVAQRRETDYEWRLVRLDGTLRHIHTRSIVITDAAGAVVRMVGTSHDITDRKLAEAQVKVLEGILPICSNCKRIRSDQGDWEAVESYVRDRSNAEFSHGLCPDCARKTWG